MSTVAGMTTPTIEVATQNVAGQDGTLADDFRVDFFLASESDAYPGTYRGVSNGSGNANWWINTPGTYYWQLSGSRRECSGNPPMCTYPKYLSPVYTLTVAATPAPSPTEPGPPLFHSVGEAKAIVRGIIKDALRTPRGLTSDCDISSEKATCDSGWYDTKYVYGGRFKITKRADDYLYRFKGKRATIRCLDKYKSVKRGLLRCNRSIRL